MDWQTIAVLVFFAIASFCAILQTIRVFLWKDKYLTLVRNLKLGENDGQTEESNSRGTEEGSSKGA